MTQESSIGSSEYFTGDVHVDPLFPATQVINAAGAYVTFEAGARSHWHSHPGGQRLIVTSGISHVENKFKKSMLAMSYGALRILSIGMVHHLIVQ